MSHYINLYASFNFCTFSMKLLMICSINNIVMLLFACFVIKVLPINFSSNRLFRSPLAFFIVYRIIFNACTRVYNLSKCSNHTYMFNNYNIQLNSYIHYYNYVKHVNQEKL